MSIESSTNKPGRERAVRHLAGQGYTAKEIAQRMEVSIEDIKALALRHKIKFSTTDLIKKKFERFNIDRESDDIATRIFQIGGFKEGIKSTDLDYDDCILESWIPRGKRKAIDCFARFCKDALGVTMQKHQLYVAQAMYHNKRVIVITGRQWGKDFLLAAYTLWLCLIKPERRIILVSEAYRQSLLLLRRALRYVGGNKALLQSVKIVNEECVVFKNNAEIWSLGATGLNRGFTEVNDVFFNEARGIPDETYKDIIPMLARLDGGFYIFSTPGPARGLMFEYFHSKDFIKFQFPTSVNKYITKKFLDSEEKRMSPEKFDMEYNGQFIAESDNFFSINSIVKCSYNYTFTNNPEAGKDYYLGIDWGRTRHNSVFLIISKDKTNLMTIENVYILKGTPFPAQLALIYQLCKTFRFKKLLPERSGLSLGPCDDLKAKQSELGVPIEFMYPNVQNKMKIYEHLRKKLEDPDKDLIRLPKHHPRLQNELRSFIYKCKPDGTMLLSHAKGGTDDVVDALAYAVYACRTSDFSHIRTRGFKRDYARGREIRKANLNRTGHRKRTSVSYGM